MEFQEFKEKDKIFNRETHCIQCKRYIDEKTVKLKKLTIGDCTYRRYENLADDPNFKYEKICMDCYYGRSNV